MQISMMEVESVGGITLEVKKGRSVKISYFLFGDVEESGAEFFLRIFGVMYNS